MENYRTKLDVQKGAVLATEIKNNNCKLAKWTIQVMFSLLCLNKIHTVFIQNIWYIIAQSIIRIVE